MTTSFAELSDAVLALPLEARTELTDKLLASLLADVPDSIKTAQLAEVQRRREEVLSGKVQLIPGEQVEREMEVLLNEISRVSPRGTR
jgi:hypothetical protein